MAEKIPYNYAILASLEETKNIINNVLKDPFLKIDEFNYNDNKNAYNIAVSGFFSDKEFEIVLTPTQNGTNIFFNFNEKNLIREILIGISKSLN